MINQYRSLSNHLKGSPQKKNQFAEWFWRNRRKACAYKERRLTSLIQRRHTDERRFAPKTWYRYTNSLKYFKFTSLLNKRNSSICQLKRNSLGSQPGSLIIPITSTHLESLNISQMHTSLKSPLIISLFLHKTLHLTHQCEFFYIPFENEREKFLNSGGLCEQFCVVKRQPTKKHLLKLLQT